MALVTIQRSPSPSVEQDLDATDSTDDGADARSQMRKRSRTSKQKLRKIFSSVRFISKLIRPGLSQSYFTVKGAALILPHTDFTKKSVRKSHGGEIQQHLQAMLHLLRPEDTIKIAVRLEDINHNQRYMALVSTKGRQDTEEAVILGIDCSNSKAAIGLVLPVWMGLQITLGGDGGFSLRTDEQCYLFKPVSVQAMWSAIQSLVKVQHIADDMKYIRDGLTHTWVSYYRSRIDRKDSVRASQWNVEGVEVFAPSSLSIKSNDDERIKLAISHTLKEVMMTVDLDEATSMMLRKAVEEKMNMSLAEFKGYFDEEVMRILGQMDEPSEILDFLYLGSEWNASNLEELIEKGIDYILNVTKEIDNFFEGRFHYYNIRVYDEDTSDLLKHWDKTYKFISKARSLKSKVLVHCKMGVSRSASTVMAFLMKDRRWTVEEAFQFVKERRNCVHPNAGFMEQLHMYQAILTASNKRDIFRSKSDQNLLEECAQDDLQPPDMSFLGEDLFHMMSHSDWLSASGGVAHGEEWIGSLYQEELQDTGMLQMGTDLDTECRSADSMEEVLPDLPSPPPESHECLSLSLPSTRASCERSSCDTEAGSESHSGKSAGSSYCQQTSVGSPTSRIKPDSSWIRLDSLDTEEENNCIHNNKLMFSEPVPCSHSFSSTDPNVGALDSAAEDLQIPDTTDSRLPAITGPHTAATEPCMAAIQAEWEMTDLCESSTDTQATLVSPSELLQLTENTEELSEETPATVSEPSGDAGSPSLGVSPTDGTNTQAQFYNGQTSFNAAPTVPPGSGDSFCVIDGQKCSATSASSLSSVEKTISSSLGEKTVSQAPRDEPGQMVLSDTLCVDVRPETARQAASHPGCDLLEPIECCAAGLEDAGEVSGHEVVDPGGSVSARDLGVKQYFFPENIPWKPGKVKKIQDDINKTGQISQDEETKDSGVVDLCQAAPSTYLGGSSESQISAHPQTTELQHSHSCMELCTQTDEILAVESLYQRERIPLTPGTVFRTKQEFEGKQRGDGEQEPHPMIRTSSLKHDRDNQQSRPTRIRTYSGPVMSAQEEKSVEKARSIGFGGIQQTNLTTLESSQPGKLKDDLPDNSELGNHFEKTEKMLQQIPGTVEPSETPTAGLKAPPTAGILAPPTTGIIAPPKDGIVAPPIAGILIPPTDGLEAPPTAGLVASPITGILAPPKDEIVAPPTDRLVAAPTGGLETPPTAGIVSPPTAGIIAPPTAGLVAPPSEGRQVNNESSEAHSSDNTQHHQGFTDIQTQARTRGNMASETLALIREIGSALLMNPTPQKPEEEEDADESRPCSNMVKYFVRNIEQQMKTARSPQRNVVVCHKSVSSEFDESRRIVTTRDEASPGTPSAVPSIVTSPSRSRQLIDLLSTPAPCTSKPASHSTTQPVTASHSTTRSGTANHSTTQLGIPSHSTTQPGTAQRFIDAPTFYSRDDPGTLNAATISLNITATSHNLVDVRSLEDSVSVRSLEDSVPVRSLEDIVPVRSLEDSVPVRSLEDSVPVRTLKDSVPVRTLEDSVPVRTLEDSVPVRTLKDSVPVRTLEDNVPVRTLEDSVPVRSLEDSSVPARSLEDSSVPARSLEDSSVPARSLEDSVPVRSLEDSSVPVRSLEDSVPVRSLEDSVPVRSLEDSVPVRSLEDSVPVRSLEDSVPVRSLEDSVPVRSLEDNVPVRTLEDNVPVRSLEDSVPARSLEDIVPVRSLEDSVPVRSLEDSVPVRTLEDSVPVRTLEDSVPVRTLEDNVPVRTLEDSVPVRSLEDSSVPARSLEDSSVPARSLEDSSVPARSLEDSVPVRSLEDSSVPVRSLEDSVPVRSLEDSVPVRSLEDSVPVRSLEDSVPVRSLEDSVPVRSLEDSVPVRSLEDNVPVRTLEDNVPVRSLEDNVPARSLEDSVPVRSLEDNVPVRTLEDSVPVRSLEDNVPVRTLEDNVPVRTLEDSVPVRTLEDSVPLRSLEDSVPVRTLEDSVPVRSLEDNVPVRTLEDNVPVRSLEDSVPVRSLEDNVPVRTLEDNVPVRTLEDSVPVRSLEDSVPVRSLEDSVPVRSLEDSVPVRSLEDNVPVRSLEDNVPVRSLEDSVPVRTLEDSVPVRTLEDNVPVRSLEDNVPVRCVEETTVPVGSLEDSNNHQSLSPSQLSFTSSGNHLSPQSSFLPVTTSSSSSSAQLRDFPDTQTPLATAQDLASVVHTDSQ